MAQGKLKLSKKAEKPKRTSGIVKKGSIANKSQKGGVYASNKKLQKKLWAKSTEKTERLMASKAKSCGKLTILKSLVEGEKKK